MTHILSLEDSQRITMKSSHTEYQYQESSRCNCVAALSLVSCSRQELFPANKQNVEHFSQYFTEAGLKELSDFLRAQQSLGTRKELQKELQERLSQQCPIREVQTV